MIRALKQTYIRIFLPAALGFAGVGTAKLMGMQGIPALPSMDLAARILFFLTAFFALALPLIIRTLFLHGLKGRRRVTEPELLGFEKRFLLGAMPAPYLALAAYGLDMPDFCVAGTFLLSLYAAYYYFPSERRINTEKRIFRTP